MCFSGSAGQVAQAAIPAAIGAGASIYGASQQQPVGSINPASMMSPQEKALLDQQVAFSQAVTPLESQLAQTTIPLQQQFQQTAIPLATQQLGQLADFEGARLGLGQTIAEGGQLPGMFSSLGQPSSLQDEQIRRALQQVATQQESLGMLSSGATRELGQQAGLDVAFANQNRQSQELQNLLGMIQGG